MTKTTSDIPTDIVSQVVTDYNKFTMAMLAEQLGPAEYLQFKAILTMAGLGFVCQRAAEEMQAVFGAPDDTGDQPGT